jgi:hypothetical protein
VTPTLDAIPAALGIARVDAADLGYCSDANIATRVAVFANAARAAALLPLPGPVTILARPDYLGTVPHYPPPFLRVVSLRQAAA